MSRTCSTCKAEKALDEFYVRSSAPLGRSYRCKQCTINASKAKYWANPQEKLNYNKKWRAENKEKIAEGKKRWRDENLEYVKQRAKEYNKENFDRIRDRRLNSIYGISASDYDRMFTEQGSCCKICKSTDNKNKNSEFFAVDHCHKTGRVRGLLCHSCNRGIGYLQDDPVLCNAASEYLKEV